ncbi:unnamed protein product [marine sediment metagenome]|uniref:DUF11 domain-containing protein n=1 Tax=marine sediment metagenome TaxID=412755 RepID=X0RU79_9ZZZZ
MQTGWIRAVLATAILMLPQLPMVRTLPAQEAPEPRALVIAAENLMAGDERHRSLHRRGLSAQILLIGDVVRYKLTFTNVTDVDVSGVAFVDPVPDGLLYVGGSASADREDARIEYSIDGGSNYAARPLIVEIVDGERVERPAPPETYTHIRWTVPGSVAPGAQVTAQFDARFHTLSAESISEETSLEALESTQQDQRPAGTDVSGQDRTE